MLLLRQVKQDKFSGEIRALQSGKKLPRQSRILEFRPVLDEDGLLHVGGRLAHPDLSMHSKHLFLLVDDLFLLVDDLFLLVDHLFLLVDHLLVLVDHLFLLVDHLDHQLMQWPT